MRVSELRVLQVRSRKKTLRKLENLLVGREGLEEGEEEKGLFSIS